MTPAEQDAIKARADAATEGPWGIVRDVEDVDNTTIRTGPGWYEEYGHRLYGVRFVAELSEGNLNDADAEFIAHARTDIPELLAEVERLRAAQARCRFFAELWEEDGDPMFRAFGGDIRRALDGAS